MSKQIKVVVAMSGGVDSSVAAALLVEQGYDVTGIMLRLWSEPGQEASNRCCTPDAMALARRVAAKLDIPFYAIDSKQPFREIVVETFLSGYMAGETPNPCVACNRYIRWGFLLKQAESLGAEFLATGHYAQVRRIGDNPVELVRGVDFNKDQSYVLSVLHQDQLKKTLLPIGAMEKPAVREYARKLGLPVAERQDSQDLCFLAGQDYRSFLAKYAPETIKPGPIVTIAGEKIGLHQGLAFFTIGQRKGLGIAYPKPLYVVDKRPVENELVVGVADDLGQDHLWAEDVNWIDGFGPDQPVNAEIKIRYKANLAQGRVVPLPGNRVRVDFEQSLRDITPGQRVVFYNGDKVLGGGKIVGGAIPAPESWL